MRCVLRDMLHVMSERKIRWVRPGLVILAIGALCGLLLLAVGARRYGGLDGLWRRAQAALGEPQAHPLFVPTPLPTAAAAARDLPPAGSISSPTPRPTPTATPLLPPSPPPLTLPTDVSLPRAAPTAAPTSKPLFQPAGAQVMLAGVRHEWQTWNNCGPATLSFQLSYFGSALRQEDIRRALRPNKEDKNVNLGEMAAFAQSQGLQALVRTHGDADRLRLLLSNGLPVLIETWLEPHPNDGMGHYRLLTGYDDAAQMWIVYDSYVSGGLKKGDPYLGIRVPYAEMEALWRIFNHTYLLVYRAEQAPLVTAILGADADAAAALQHGLARAQADVDARPQDAFAWFNLGSNLTALAQFADAAAAYDRARQLGLPWRMLWYQFGPFEAYFEAGREAEVLALADATLKTTTDVEELYFWRGRALAALGDTEGARQAFARAVALNPRFAAAVDELAR